jgi:uncharacterized protein (TIGR01777 family)
MDVAVTGASGLIGSALARALEADGHRVLRVVRPSSAASGGDTVTWSPADGTIDRAGLEGIDAVVHLAGEGIAERRWSDEQKRRILESRTTGSSLLATTLAGLQRPPKVLLSSSAIGFYGDRGTEVLTEQSAPGQGFLTDVCVAWEGATRPAEEAGIRVAHLRTGIVLDRSGGALAKLVPLFRLGLGGRLGNGRQMWSWISLPDHIAATRFLLDAPISGPVNLTGPAPVSNAEFTKVLARAVHRPALFPVPAFGPGIVLGRELAHNLLFTSADVRPAVLRDAGFTFAHPDVETALAAVLARA